MKLYRSLNDFARIENAVVSQGTFDGVHIGHQEIIRRMLEVKERTGGETVLLSFFPHPRMVLYPDNEDFKILQIFEEKVERFDKYGIDHLIVEPFTTHFSRQTTEEFVRDILVDKIGGQKFDCWSRPSFWKKQRGWF
jgi:riboflavin kinase/FMN adenylyltransferase